MKQMLPVFFLLFIWVGTLPVTAGERCEFSEIHSQILDDYGTYAFKFTYQGAQKKVIPTNGGQGPDREFNVDDFKPFYRSIYRYDNDDIFVASVISLSNHEFKAFVDAIGEHPELHSIDNRTAPNASLMLIRDFDASALCWEYLANREETACFSIC